MHNPVIQYGHKWLTVGVACVLLWTAAPALAQRKAKAKEEEAKKPKNFELVRKLILI